MAWTAPPTFVSGQILTAAEQNILGTDIGLLATSLPMLSEVVFPLAGSAPSSPEPGNYYMQCGTVSGVTSGFNISVTFPVAFPGGVASVLVTPQSIAASSTGVTWTSNVYAASTTGFGLTTSENTVLIAFSWLAIGF